MSIALLPAWGYATARGTWRGGVRAELGDSGTPPLWSDALLNAWLAEAIGDFARQFPREETIALTGVAGQAAYDLPLGLVEVVRVEQPAEQFRLFAPRGSGDAARLLADTAAAVGTVSAAEAASYDVWRGQLVLLPAPAATGEPIVVRYTTRRAVPAADTDPLPVEVGDTELLTLYVCARALAWVAAQEGKRQAVERQRGADALGLAEWYARRYRDGLAARGRTGTRARRLVVT